MQQHLRPPVATAARHPSLADPWEAALAFGPGTVLAVLVQTHGPAYRMPGTGMAIAGDSRFAGALSSGCIEADLILHAAQVRANGLPLRLRYGQGSPFVDLRLPCGGAIEVMLFLVRDFDVLADLSRARASRRAAVLHLSGDGRLGLGDGDAPARNGDLQIPFKVPIRFVIFGAGPEAAVFADLARAMDYEHVLLSHEDQSLSTAERMGCSVRLMDKLPDFVELVPDDRCAALLFYHDHDYEPEILRHVLRRPAFYIGAQGSRATQAARIDRLRQMGVPDHDLGRVRGPIGLIPSLRDPRLLAISVMAEVVMAVGDQVMMPAVT